MATVNPTLVRGGDDVFVAVKRGDQLRYRRMAPEVAAAQNLSHMIIRCTYCASAADVVPSCWPVRADLVACDKCEAKHREIGADKTVGIIP